MLLFCQITVSIILITHPALHLLSLCVFSGFHSFLSNLSLISWIGLRNKSRGAGGYILVTRCRGLALGGRRNRFSTCWGNIFHHPGGRLWKLALRSHPDHSTSTKLVIMQSKSKAFDEHFSHYSLLQSGMLNWNRFCFVSLPGFTLLITTIILQDALN